MKLYVVDGPIGSGKTSLLAFLLRATKCNIEIVSADVYYNAFFEGVFPESKRSYILANQFLEYKKKQLLRKKEAFILEIVLSKEEKLDYLRECKYLGYSVIGIYVGTDAPEINITRVRQRNKLIESSVSEKKVLNRYYRCMNNMRIFFGICDEFMVINNSTDPEVIHYSIGKRTILRKQNYWLDNYLPLEKSWSAKSEL